MCVFGHAGSAGAAQVAGLWERESVPGADPAPAPAGHMPDERPHNFHLDVKLHRAGQEGSSKEVN